MTATTASATCLLLIGDRVVLRASGPPEAEYAMFEIGEIELRASEPGRVREHGYQTTVEQARSRLAHLGIKAGVARELSLIMQPVLSDAYARGNAVRRVARYLSPLELFQSDGYDASQRTYRGVFLDLATLARDLELEHAGPTLQAFFLATVLETEADDTTILLSTDACTKNGKPGARTHKRPSFADARRLLNALGGLVHKGPTPAVQDALPRADVIAFLRARADSAGDEDARALYKSLEGTVSLRDMPDKGPLALPDLWTIETRLDSGDFEGVLDAIEDAERRHGRTPGTTYLRARAALTMRLEPPKLVAERVSALALSMTSFQELALLAAESWLDAGEPRRAMPYARDLVDSNLSDEGLLLRAQRLLARAVGAAPQENKHTLVDTVQAAQPSRPPPIPEAEPDVGLEMDREPVPDLLEPSPLSLGSEHLVPDLPTPPPPPPASTSIPSLSPPARPSRGVPPPLPSAPGRLRAPPVPSSRKLPAAAPVSHPVVPAPLLPPELPPPSASRARSVGVREQALASPPELDSSPADPVASFTLDLPRPESVSPPMPARATAPPESPKPARRTRLSGVLMETRPPSASDPRAEPDGPIVPRSLAPAANEVRRHSPLPEPRPAPARRAVPPPETIEISAHDRSTPLPPPSGAAGPLMSNPPPQTDGVTEGASFELEPPPSPGTRPNEDVESAFSPLPPKARTYMYGASLPPYRHESPAPLLARAPLLPKLGGAADELAEHLSLPPGLGVEQPSLDALPTSVLEARVVFTLLARELGLDYRLKRGIDLHADVSGIEAMQSVLLESFPDRVVRTSDEAYELRRHGALLSEILARRLDAEWMDISPNELGYWVMIVPPDTRVWPFGRVARLIAMGHRERDLVSYYLELQSRARGR